MPVNPSLRQTADKLGEKAKIVEQYSYKLRVRYNETDAQGRVHHAVYPNYFELARVEMLRASGVSYRELEAAGVNLVVVKLEVNYHQGAVFDDEIEVKIRTGKAKGVRIQHVYELFVDGRLIVDGMTTVASIGPDGNVVRLPKWLTKQG